MVGANLLQHNAENTNPPKSPNSHQHSPATRKVFFTAGWLRQLIKRQRTGNIPNTITLQGIPILLPVHTQPVVRSWCPITSENSSFSIKLLLAGLSSHTNHERKIQPLLQPGKSQRVPQRVLQAQGCRWGQAERQSLIWCAAQARSQQQGGMTLNQIKTLSRFHWWKPGHARY